MLRHLRKIALIASGALFFFVSSAHAQFIGYTSPQTVSQNFTGACSATTPLVFVVANLGQSAHAVNYNVTSSPGNPVTVTMRGISAATGASNIAAASTGMNGNMVGSGYYAQFSISVTCLNSAPINVSVSYSGTSVTPFLAGSTDITTYDQFLTYQADASANQSYFVTPPPFGNTAGVLVFFSGGGAPSGSTLEVWEQPAQGYSLIGNERHQVAVFNLTTSTSPQFFFVPPAVASNTFVRYGAGGASANVYSVEYIFQKPGINTPQGSSAHITGTTATAVKNSPGFLSQVVIGTPAAGTVSVFDLAAAACTGTPSTNTLAVLTAIATDPPSNVAFGLNFVNGLCVKASAGMDLTVVYQ